jgi:hypothetical protein
MKKVIKLLASIIASFLLIQCILYQKKTTFIFENKSDLHVDSVTFTINKYKNKITNIRPGKREVYEILRDSVDTNLHDITIIGSIFCSGKLIKGGFYHNDLSGSLNDQYTLTLNSNMTTTLE